VKLPWGKPKGLKRRVLPSAPIRRRKVGGEDLTTAHSSVLDIGIGHRFACMRQGQMLPSPLAAHTVHDRGASHESGIAKHGLRSFARRRGTRAGHHARPVVGSGSRVPGLDVHRRRNRLVSPGGPAGLSEPGPDRRCPSCGLEQRRGGGVPVGGCSRRDCFRLAGRQDRSRPFNGDRDPHVFAVHGRLRLCPASLGAWRVPLSRLVGHGRRMGLGGRAGHGMLAGETSAEIGRSDRGGGEFWILLYRAGGAAQARDARLVAMDDVRGGPVRPCWR